MRKKRYWKTKVVRDDPDKRETGASWFFTNGGSDLRDTSKPVCYDEHGRPLYAPRGIVTKTPGDS